MITEVGVPARVKWFDTGVDVRIGSVLEFKATGLWRDLWFRRSADGYSAKLFYWLGFEPRVADSYRYFRLLGRIADSKAPPSTDTPIDSADPDATFVVGSCRTYHCLRAGRLYVFANDASYMYWNNCGAVELSIVHS